MTITITTGVEGPVDSASANSEARSSVAALPGGGYAIAWEGDNTEAGELFVQLFDAGGQASGSAVRVNAGNDAQSVSPADPISIAALSDGGFVVTWGGPPGGSGFNYDVFAQRFDAGGHKVGAETTVNTITQSDQRSPVVAGLTGGGYVVAWSTDAYDNNNVYAIYAQQYDASGNKIGTEFEVDTDQTHSKGEPAIAALPDGGYLIAWDSNGQQTFNDVSVYSQRFNAAGAKVGAETSVSAASSVQFQDYPSVAVLSSGGWVVVWQAWDGSNGSVIAQVFNSAGSKVGGQITVNTSVPHTQAMPSVTALAGGGWMAAWTGTDASGTGIYAQAFDSAGNKVGGEILEPTDTAGNQLDVAAATLADGQPVLTWATVGGDALNPTGTVIQKLIGQSHIGSALSSAVETAQGDGADDTFLAAPGTLNPGDRIDGGGGANTVQLTAAQTADFTNVSIANVQTILGSAGDDTLIFPSGPPAGVTLNSGGGHDTLEVAGALDLSTLSLVGTWTVAPQAGQFADFTLTSAAQVGEISGAGGDLTVDASAVALTAAQRSQLFAAGVATILQPNGVTLLASGGAVLAEAATPVPTTHSFSQTDGAVTAQLANGDYVVTWQSEPTSGNGPSIFFQMYDEHGAKVGAQTAADGTATQDGLPAIAALSGGGFIELWSGADPQNGFQVSNYLQAFDASGAKVGALVDLGVAAGAAPPEAAGLPDGGYIVVYETPQQNPSVGYQRFDAAGHQVATGPVPTIGYGSRWAPEVAALVGGGWVVAWNDGGTATSSALEYRVFDASGAPVADEQQAAPAGGGVQVAALAGGGFVLVWDQFDGSGVLDDVFAQRFTAAGAAVGSAAMVNTTTAGAQDATGVAALADGGYLVTWQTGGNGTSTLFTQRFDATGARVGPETLVTPGSATFQGGLAAAGLANGSYVVTYEATRDQGQDVYQQLYQSVDFILTPGADSFVGSNKDLYVITAPGDLSAGDSVVGGTGHNELAMTSSGVLDLTAPAQFSGFGTITGASGDDTFVVSTGRLAGITTFDGGPGSNQIVATDAQLDLSHVTLKNIQSVGTHDATGTVFTLPGGLSSFQVTGGSGLDTFALPLEASAARLTHNGDGSWTAAAPGYGVTRLTGVEQVQFSDQTVALVAQWAERHDYNADGASDLLFGQSNGTLAEWQMTGTAISGGGAVGAPGGTWAEAGVGDFNRDGAADILFHDASGALAIWEMNGTAIVGGGVIGNPAGTWAVKGVGDFDGDGRSDILFQDAGGNLATWQMNGTAIAGGGGLGSPGGTWAVQGVGDFNGDGKSDILFADAAGNLAIWEMNGTAIAGGGNIGNPGGTWAVKGVGDFNGDGHSDILFEDASGAYAIWDMNGTAIVGGGQIGDPGGSWAFAGVGDYNGDGWSDILFTDASGNLAIWEMRDTQIVGGGAIGNPGAVWHVLG